MIKRPVIVRVTSCKEVDTVKVKVKGVIVKVMVQFDDYNICCGWINNVRNQRTPYYYIFFDDELLWRTKMILIRKHLI